MLSILWYWSRLGYCCNELDFGGIHFGQHFFMSSFLVKYIISLGTIVELDADLDDVIDMRNVTTLQVVGAVVMLPCLCCIQVKNCAENLCDCWRRYRQYREEIKNAGGKKRSMLFRMKRFFSRSMSGVGSSVQPEPEEETSLQEPSPRISPREVTSPIQVEMKPGTYHNEMKPRTHHNEMKPRTYHNEISIFALVFPIAS